MAEVFLVAIEALVYGCGLLLLVMIGAKIYWSIAFPFTEEGRQAKAERKRLLEQIEASRRIEVIDGRRWEVVTKPHTLLRNKKTGRYAAVLGHGGQRDPSMDQGKLSMVPRWVRVQPLTRQLVPAKAKQHWTQTQSWEIAGVVEVHWKDRPSRDNSEGSLKNA